MTDLWGLTLAGICWHAQAREDAEAEAKRQQDLQDANKKDAVRLHLLKLRTCNSSCLLCCFRQHSHFTGRDVEGGRRQEGEKEKEGREGAEDRRQEGGSLLADGYVGQRCAGIFLVLQFG